jgi:ribonuclease D
MWEARDRLASGRDIFPGRVLPDAALVAAATALPRTREQLAAIPPYNGRRQIKLLNYWWSALEQGARLPSAQLPSMRGPQTHSTPPVRHWEKRHPQAALRMAQVKTALAELSEAEQIPVENLMQPELVRQVVFRAVSDTPAALAAGGARGWQIEAVAPIIEAAAQAYPD